MASKFEKAFAAARKAGRKTFPFGGKIYNTKLRATPKTAPKPTPRSKRPEVVGNTPRHSTPKTFSGSPGGKASPMKNSGRPVGFSTKRYTGPGKK